MPKKKRGRLISPPRRSTRTSSAARHFRGLRFHRHERTKHPTDNAKNSEVLPWLNFDFTLCWIGRCQKNFTVVVTERLHGGFVTKPCGDDVVLLRLRGGVHHNEISIGDRASNHA